MSSIKRLSIIVVLVAAIAMLAMNLSAAQAGQRGAAPAVAAANKPPAKPTPRAADGHPDLSGVWWGGGDVGPNLPRGGPRVPAFSSLYTPEAAAKAKTLSDKDDPTLKCIPTAFGTLNVSLYSVGAVGQIIQTPKFIVMLQETFHGFQLIPVDGRPHRDDVPPAYRGDSIGHWEGDVLVVDTTNYTDNTWISAEGRVSFHSDAMHVVERYHRTDFNTLEIDARVEDPKVLTGPWIVPTQKLVLAPFDMVMSLACSGLETDALMQGAQKAK